MSTVKQFWKQCILVGFAFMLVLLVSLGYLDLGEASPTFAALIAGLVAFSINETVDQRRNREIEAKLRGQREEAYRDVVGHLLQSFTGGPQAPEFEIRRKIALWASKDFMRQYADWRKSISGLAGPTAVLIPPDRRASIQEGLGRVCVAARKDLKIEARDTPSVEDITGILFDDYTPTQTGNEPSTSH